MPKRKLAFWRGPIVVLIPAFVLVSALIVFLANERQQVMSQQPATKLGTITAIGTAPGKHATKPFIAITLSGGKKVQLGAEYSSIRHCRVGSTIRLHKRGLNLRVAPNACSRQKDND